MAIRRRKSTTTTAPQAPAPEPQATPPPVCSRCGGTQLSALLEVHGYTLADVRSWELRGDGWELKTRDGVVRRG